MLVQDKYSEVVSCLNMVYRKILSLRCPCGLISEAIYDGVLSIIALGLWMKGF